MSAEARRLVGVTALLALLAAAIVPVFGTSADQAVTPMLYIVLLLWMLAAPAWAARRHPKAVSIVVPAGS